MFYFDCNNINRNKHWTDDEENPLTLWLPRSPFMNAFK